MQCITQSPGPNNRVNTFSKGTHGMSRAITLLVVDPSMTLEIFGKVEKIDGVTRLYQTMGPYDIIALLEGSDEKSIAHTLREVRSIPGIESTTTLVSLSTEEESTPESDENQPASEDTIIRAFVLIVVDPIKSEKVFQALQEIDASLTELVDMVSGPYDMVVIMKTPTLTDVPGIIARSVRNIDGIESTTTCVTFPTAPAF